MVYNLNSFIVKRIVLVNILVKIKIEWECIVKNIYGVFINMFLKVGDFINFEIFFIV